MPAAVEELAGVGSSRRLLIPGARREQSARGEPVTETWCRSSVGFFLALESPVILW